MHKSYFITGAALAAVITIGCFNLLGQQSSPPQTTKNLGVVEFTNGIPRYFSLGDAKSCTATARYVTNQYVTNRIEVDFLIQVTNSDRMVYPLGAPSLIIAIPDQYGEITSGGVRIKLKPILKKP
jgi:hypothetical protein